jgi:hypothetical protein
MLAVDQSYGQEHHIKGRTPAAEGPADNRVTEPGIAAGPQSVVTVFFDLGTYSTWYGAYNVWTRQWREGEIEHQTGSYNYVDLSVAYDGINEGFVAAALASDPGNSGSRHLVACRFVEGPAVGDVTQLGWVDIPGTGGTPDKPWIVAGKPNLLSGQEFYIVYIGSGTYQCLRSRDGGQSWVDSPIDPNGPPVGSVLRATGGLSGRTAVRRIRDG